MKSTVAKRSIVLAGHKTSISLEDVKSGTRSLRQCPISATSMIARSALSPSSPAPSARR